MSDQISVGAPLAQRPVFGRVDTDVDVKDAKTVSPDPENSTTTVDNKNEMELSQVNEDRLEFEEEKAPGVIKIEALYLVFGKGPKLFILWGSIGLVAIVYTLSAMTTYYYTPFATSAYGEHTILGTITVINSIMGGVAKPFIAKLADLFSRPWALAFSVLFYAVGYAVVAGSKNVSTVAGGEVLYTLGNTGISFVMTVLLADITSLQWRGLANALYTLPYIPFCFVAGNISSSINAYSENGWRWGYGMFCIMVPCAIAPALVTLFWAGRRAKQLGALSLASSTYARDRVLSDNHQPRKPLIAAFLDYSRKIDAVGVLLLGFAFGCILTPFTLNTTAVGGYNNPSLIALLVVGGILFIATVIWEWKFASHPIMPMRIFNRTFISAVGINVMYFLSSYLSDAYWSSWLYVVFDYSAKDYTYVVNTQTVALCIFALPAGLIQRYTHRFKYLQIFALCFRIIGMGLNYYLVKGGQTNAVVVISRIIISFGAGISTITSLVASQASVPHNDLALASAILYLWTAAGGAIGSAISASVWNRRVPEALNKYVGDVYNQTEIANIFGSIVVARATEPRKLIIEAYNEAIRPLFLAALITSFGSVIFGFLSENLYLGDTQNAIEDIKIVIRSPDETEPEVVARKAHEAEAEAAARLNIPVS